MQWRLKTRVIECDRPRVMGIVNVTPDSFSDGGKFFDPDQAIAHALSLADEGADILDIGGESTRPYSEAVDEQQELDRVIPVVEALAERVSIPISIDTSKARVAQTAIDAGAEIINDVTGLLGHPDMIKVAVNTQVGVCAMHMQATPQTMQDNPSYTDVVQEIFDYLKARRESLIESGIDARRICLDPGIGFGKTHEHNWTLIQNCNRFLELAQPILFGHSRKGFIGKAIGNKEFDRDYGTLAASLFLASRGVHLVRVHNVAATVQGIAVQNAISNSCI